MLSKARQNIFEIKKNKHTFYVNNHSPNIFPVLANFSLCQNKIPCVFHLEKVRTKFPVFPVPWPPCKGKRLLIFDKYSPKSLGIKVWN